MPSENTDDHPFLTADQGVDSLWFCYSYSNHQESMLHSSSAPATAQENQGFD